MIQRIIKSSLQLSFGAVTLILAFILLLNLNIIFQGRESIYSLQEFDNVSLQEDVAILVLGAGVIENRYPSPILANRLDSAYEIHRKFPDLPIIVSGDHREDNYNEVAVMKQYLVGKGIDSSLIYQDHVGLSTYDSLFRARHIGNLDQVIIVTQNYHLSRALLIAKKLGMEAIGYASADVENNQWQRKSREFGARLKDYLLANLNKTVQASEMNYPYNLQRKGDASDNKANLFQAIDTK